MTNEQQLDPAVAKLLDYGKSKKEITWDEINEWVERETDGMIPRILDHLDDDSLMVLVNTLAFQADWKEIYETDEIFENVFTLEDGTEKNVKFMYGII